MALNKKKLQSDIESVLNNLRKQTDDPAKASKDFATQLADAIDSYVKSGSVSTNVTGNITGTTTAVVGTGTGNII